MQLPPFFDLRPYVSSTMSSKLVAVEYDILRDLTPSGRVSIPLERRPVRVATMLREDAFLASGGVMKHHVTVFLEDESHDWRWDEGRFWYYTRVADKADVLVAYQTVRVGEFVPEEWVEAFATEQKLHGARRQRAARLVHDVYDRHLCDLRALSADQNAVLAVSDSMLRYLRDNADALPDPWQVDLYAWLASHKGFATVLTHHAKERPKVPSPKGD